MRSTLPVATIFTTLIFALLTSNPASSQAVGAARQHDLSAFGEFTTSKVDQLAYGGGFTYGGTGGFDYQFNNLLTIEGRGTALRAGVSLPRYDALIGPSITLSHFRFSPYGSFLIGIARPSYVSDATDKPDHCYCLMWDTIAGVDTRLSYRWSWRVEYDYSRIFALKNGLTPFGLSTGLKFRIFK